MAQRNSKEELRVLDQLQELNRCKSIHDEVIFRFQRKAWNSVSGAREELAGLSAQLEAINPADLKSLSAKLFVYNALVYLYFSWMEIEVALDQCRAMAVILESNPKFTRENLRYYVSTLNNMAAGAHYTKQTDLLLETLDKMSALQPIYKGKKTAEAARVFGRIFHTRANFFTELGRFSSCLALEEEIDWGLRFFKDMIEAERAVGMLFPLIVANLGSGHWHNALKRVNQVLEFPNSKLLPIFQDAIVLINCVVHQELGNWDLLESLLERARRHLGGRDHLTPPVKALLHFLQRLLQEAPPEKDYPAVARECLHDLEDLDSMTLGWHPYSWLKAKSEGRPYQEVLVESFARIAKS